MYSGKVISKIIEEIQAANYSLESLVFLITSGDGSSGNDWTVHCVFSVDNLEMAFKAIEKIPFNDVRIEVWQLNSENDCRIGEIENGKFEKLEK